MNNEHNVAGPSFAVGVPDKEDSIRVVVSRPDDDRCFAAYCRGLAAQYDAIGAGHLARGAHAPTVQHVRALVLLVRRDRVIGGIRLREDTDIPAYQGLELLHATIDARRPEGLNEAKGLWLESNHQGLGLGMRLIRAAVALSAGWSERWLVAISSDRATTMAVRAGFRVDGLFRNMPFPSATHTSSLSWFDHRRTR